MAEEPPPIHFVGVAVSSYATEPALPDAVSNMHRLADALRSRHEGVSTRFIDDPDTASLATGLPSALGAGTLKGATLIVCWTGHGSLVDQQLSLIARVPGADVDDEAETPQGLVRRAVATRAEQILLILDTCHSGEGLAPAMDALQRHLRNRTATAGRWLGVLAASRPRQKAISGAVPERLERLLREGPREPSRRHGWRRSGRHVTGEELLGALKAEWDEPTHQPEVLRWGQAAPVLANPIFRAAGELDPRLLQAARGTSLPGHSFHIPRPAITTVDAWLQDGEPGLMMLCGGWGTGKSGLLGRLIEPASDRPGGSIDGVVDLRGRTLEDAVRLLCDRTVNVHGDTHWMLLADAEQRRSQGRMLVVALDSLDEMPAPEATRLVEEVLQPLARRAKVLVASGPCAARDALEQPGPRGSATAADGDGDITAVRVDLDGDDLPPTVEQYTRGRLEAIDDRMNAATVAAHLRRLSADRPEGAMLLARLITARLRAEPIDTSDDGWQRMLATSVGTVVDADVDRAAVQVDGVPQPGSARELLYSLSFAKGPGFPVDGAVWGALASALGRSGNRYRHEHIHQLVQTLRRYLVIDTLGDEITVRIADNRLVEHLRRSRQSSGHDTVAHVVATAYRDHLEAGGDPRGRPYLWRYAWAHLAEAGAAGIEQLEALAALSAELEPDVGPALVLAAQQAGMRGDVRTADYLMTRAVARARDATPDGSADLAQLIVDLSLLRDLAGGADADRLLDEGLQMARTHGSGASGREALRAALSGRAHAALRRGSAGKALRLAREAASIDSGSSTPPVMAVMTWAEAALAFGDDKAALAAIARLESADRDGPPQPGGPLLPLLCESVRVRAAGLPLLTLQRSIDELPPTDLRPLRRLVETAWEDGETPPDALLNAVALLASQVLRPTAMDFSLPEAVALLDRALARHPPETDEALDDSAAGALGIVLLLRGTDHAPGGLDRAESLLRRSLRVDPSKHAGLLQVLRARATAAGDPQRKLQHLAEGARLPLWSTVPQQVAMLARTCVEGAHLASQLGDLRAADELTARAIRLLDDHPRVAAVMGLHHLALLSDSLLFLPAVTAIQRGAELLRRLAEGPGDPARLLLRLNTASAVASAHQALLQHRASLTVLDAAAAEIPDTDDARPHTGDADVATRIEALAASIDTGRLYSRAKLGAANPTADLAWAHATVQRARAVVDRIPQLLPYALATLVRCADAAGDEAAASTAVEELGVLLRPLLDMAGGQAAARIANLGGATVWRHLSAMEDLEPDVAASLSQMRQFEREEAAEAVAHVDALRAGADADQPGAWRLRARMLRGEDPAAFDAAWLEQIGPVPAGLRIDLLHQETVQAWWLTPTWEESQEVLERYHDLLTHEGTEALVHDVADAFDGLDWVLRGHLDALAEARSAAAPAVFTRLRARDALRHVEEETETVTALGRILRDHDADVVMGVLHDAEMFRLEALVELLRRGEQPLARTIERGEAAWGTLLADVTRTADSRQMRALGSLCWLDDRTETTDRVPAAVTLLLGMVLEGAHADVDDAVGTMQEELPAEARREIADGLLQSTLGHQSVAGDLVAVAARLAAPS